jgi:hypothetical protein
MSKITQLIPNNHIHVANLEKNIKIQTTNSSIKKIQFINTLSNKIVTINPIHSNEVEMTIELPKYFEAGKYEVSGICENGTQTNTLEYICYPALVKPQIDKISVSGGQFTINGSGFNKNTILTAYYGNNIKNLRFDLISNEELICYLENYKKDSSKEIAIQCKVNDVESMSMIYLEYNEPKITSLSHKQIVFDIENTITIYGENLCDSFENMNIIVDDKTIEDCAIITCNNDRIECKFNYNEKIGKCKICIEISGIRTNYLPIDIVPVILSLSHESIYIGAFLETEVILRGTGFERSSQLMFNGVIQEYTEVLSENEIVVNLDQIKKAQEIHISVITHGIETQQTKTIKIIDHEVSKLSSNHGFVNESSELTIHGFGFRGKIQCIIEKNNNVVETIDIESESDDNLEITMPKINENGVYMIYIVKQDGASKKYEYKIIPKSITCYPNMFPVAIDEINFVDVYMKSSGNIDPNDIEIELTGSDYCYTNPKVEKIENNHSNAESLFSFQAKESFETGKINIKMSMYGILIQENHITFMPKILKIHPKVIQFNEESYIEINGHGFSNDMEIKIMDIMQEYKLSDNNSCIRLDPFKPIIVGPLDIQLSQKEFQFTESIFVKPIFERIEFPTENISIENPYFYVIHSGVNENMKFVAKINDCTCSCKFITPEKIMIIVDASTKIVDSQFEIELIHNDKTIEWYKTIFEYPQIIASENKYGSCYRDSTIIINGYNIDENTSVIINDKLFPSTFIKNTNELSIVIPNENKCSKYEITTISKNGMKSINQLFFETTPELIQLSESKGSAGGGNTIMIESNSNFDKVVAVWFGEIQTIDNMIVDNTITCTIPPSKNNACEKINIKVETKNNVFTNSLEYQYMPYIKNQSIQTGFIGGGYECTLFGYGFLECNQIKFGDSVVNYFTEHTKEHITFNIPRAKNEIDEIEFYVCDAREGNKHIVSNIVNFTYQMPLITHIEPSYGYIRGGDDIIIFGEGFTNDSLIYVGKYLINSPIISDNNIRFVSPESSSVESLPVCIKIGDRTNEKTLEFTYKSQTITSIYPDSGSIKGGYTVTICGYGFSTKNICISVGDIIILKSDFLKHEDELIEFIMPANSCATKIEVDVIVNNVKSIEAIPFFYISKLNAISTSSAVVNAKTQIVLEGEGFNGMSIVKMGSTTINNTSFDPKKGTISFSTPLFNVSQSMPITVTTNNSTSNSIMFTIKPIIKTINPKPWNAEDVGFLYVIGEGFSSASIGCIMGIDKTEPKIIEPIKISNNTLVFYMPYIKNSGEINIAIGTAIGDDDSWILRNITIYPCIKKLSENNGSILGSNKIEIMGTGFNKYSKIVIDGQPIDECRTEYVNENLIIMTVPPSNILKEISIHVECNNIKSNTISYNYCPFIKDIKPNYSTLNGGTNAVLCGEGLNENSIVMFNNNPISKNNITYDNSKKEMSFVVPPHFEVENTIVKIITNEIESCNFVKFFYTPVIENLSVNHSSINKKEIITIFGDGFSFNSMIKLGDKFVESQNIIKITNNAIQFQLPIIDEQSIKEIRVFTNSIPSALSKSITFSAEFSKIIPNCGPIFGGTNVNIYGYGFNDELIVFFNEVKIDYKLISNSHITINTPKDSGLIGNNKIIMQCNKYITQITINFVCYPSISYITQKYNESKKKTLITLYGNGFSNSANVEIGNIKGLTPVFVNNTLKVEIDQDINAEIKKPHPVHVIVNGLKTHDEVLYTNIPTIKELNIKKLAVNNNEVIFITGCGFDVDNSIVVIDKLNMKIKPVFISSCLMKFRMPKYEYIGKTDLVVMCYNIPSNPYELIFSPSVFSSSKTSCSAGEEIIFKIYGEGFEQNKTDIFVKDHGKCSVLQFINNKILEIKLPCIKKCGIAEIYSVVREIESLNKIKFEICPVILSLSNENKNSNNEFILNGIGMHSIDSVVFAHKNNEWSTSNITKIENINSTYETIKVEYKSNDFFEKCVVDKTAESFQIDIVVETNGIKSMPYKWNMKNTEHTINTEIESIKAITICNNFLKNNYISKYQFIQAYPDRMARKINELITNICDLPGTYSNSKAENILIDGFMKEYENTDVGKIIVKNTMTRMSRTIIDMLSSGYIYKNINANIDIPLTINSAIKKTEIDNHDYFFQECLEYRNGKVLNTIDSLELSRCISFRILNDNSLEFKYNEEILKNVCFNFNELFMNKKFVLASNYGQFQGSHIECPEGTIPELFIYKITSALIEHPEKEMPFLNVAAIKQNIINKANNSNENIGKQLNTLLTNSDILKKIYEQCSKNDIERFPKKKNNNDFTPMPFKKGDKLIIQLFISEKIEYANGYSKTNIKSNEIFYKICDPDQNNDSDANQYIFNNDATEIKYTRDCYEIILG